MTDKYDEVFQVVPLQKVLQFYANEFDASLKRLPLTGAVEFDSWIEHDEVVFRVWRTVDHDGQDSHG